jgi:DtxR family Mn-dependent transcriptional regulator
MIDIDYIVVKTLLKSGKSLKIGEIKKILDNDPFINHSELFHKNGISHSTLGSCIKRLNKQDYVDYKPYHEVHLTKLGFELAKELNRHNRLLELLLFNELGLSPKESHNESEKTSLLFSCEIINKICEKYGHPKTCPCGEPILNSTECACSEKQ